jgi:murein DD-endopeptidase MepM/ murein hydrolase activator NlpD
MKKKLKLASVGIAALVTGGILTVAPSAHAAAARDGVCDTGEFCLYYNSNYAGSVSDFTTSIADYGTTQPSCYDFNGAGNGKGLCVKNEAASVWNRTSVPVTVFFNSGYRGASQGIAAGAKANLNAELKNENASHQFGTNTTGREDLSHGLYDATGGRIKCLFDDYQTVAGRHEGIDIARSIGSPVRALVPGQIINIVRGANGGALSTIAVYNATYDKTVIYLHSAPLSSLAVGQTVSRDQQIATEAWRGITSTIAHTHVEVRDGRRTLAAVSRDDPTLDNPNPYAFWNARGYNIH